MLKGIAIGAAAAVIIMILINQAVYWLPGLTTAKKPDSIAAYKKIHEISTLIDKYYLGDVDEEKLTDYMCLGLAAGLEDKYSTYYTKEEYASVTKSQEGEYTGIGIGIAQREEDGRLVITSVTANGPADRAGIEVDDILISVNSTSTDGMAASDVSNLIKKLGSKEFEISVYRPGTKETIQGYVQSEVIEDVSVTYEMLDGNIGYIKIANFIGVTAKQFDEARKALEEQGAVSMIIDLRDNLGGLVTAACDTLSSFMPEGLIVYTEDAQGKREEHYSQGENPLDLPLVLLVNESTASAAEIFSGAVKDYGIATLVGTITYGKGIVQNTYKLSDGSALKITAAKYFTPNGNNIHEVGIEPDIVVENDGEDDAQLARAIEILS